jgi:TonB family protein
MEKVSKKKRRTTLFLIVALLIVVGILSWDFFFSSGLKPRLGEGWKTLTRESRRILGWEKGEIPPEEKRIREEVIAKKRREADASRDWRTFAPEYPRPKKLEASTEEERMRALRNSPEFKEMEKELIEYLREKGDLLYPEPPIPSIEDAPELTQRKDKETEKVIERLTATREKAPQEKPLEENLRLGIKGPLAARKILERPKPPQVKVKVEAEIEMTIWVLPNGTVERVVPSVRGDAELERIAIQYLKQWRFVSLSRDQPQVEQWGTIPIKFKLQ